MPDELPDILMSENFIPADQMTVISVIPKVITITSNDLKRYAPQVRRCYLRSERPLRFFRSYSQRKCELECLANFIKKTCGCVHYGMPSTWKKTLWFSYIRKLYQIHYFTYLTMQKFSKRAIFNVTVLKCVDWTMCNVENPTFHEKKMVFQIWFAIPFTGDYITKVCRYTGLLCNERAQAQFHNEFVVKQCDCLPGCTSVVYEKEIQQTQRFHFESEEKRREGYVRNG